MSPVLPRKREVWLSRHSVASRHLFCAVSGREASLSAGRTAAVLSVNEYKQRFQAPAAYWLFGIINMSIVRLLILWKKFFFF